MKLINTLKKSERLKSKKTIEQIFKAKQSISVGFLTAFYIKGKVKSVYPVHFGISVPKKKISKAVDRNLLKRRVKEAYRKNKDTLYQTLVEIQTNYDVMLVYNTKDIKNYQEIEDKIKSLINRLVNKAKDEYSAVDTH